MAADSAKNQTDETREQRDARMGWWREAKFGMFIHWGVYSVPAGIYHDKAVPGIGEWIMSRGKIPCAEYQAFAPQFTAAKFDAREWVKTAKEAGMKYMVITAKHHDGFAMFDTKANDWNIVQRTPFKRDPLKELAEACRSEGMKLGFYYSQAQDWNNGGSAMRGKWDKAQEHSMDDYIAKTAVPQVRELLNNYGPGIPAILWWDTPTDMNKARAEKLDQAVKELAPTIVTNNRLGGGFGGDTETPEQHIPATGYPGRDWETCMTLNDTWGFKRDDNNWKSTTTLIRNLVDIASKGGNYLLNVGPTSEGVIPEPSVKRLAEVGQWMKTNGESIYGTTANIFSSTDWGRCTRKLGTLYLHVFDWPQDGRLIVPVFSKVLKARLLAERDKALPMQSGVHGVVITLPAAAPDAIDSVVALEVEGEPATVARP